MTNDTLSVKALLWKSADANFLREMIRCAVQRLMDLDVEARRVPAVVRRAATGLRSATATAIGIGRRAPARSNCASPS